MSSPTRPLVSPGYSVPRPARRVSKDPKPSDLALALIEKRIVELNRLRSIVVTDEYNQLANLVFPHSEHAAANPEMDGQYARVTFNVYLSGLTRWTDPKLTSLLDAIQKMDPDHCELSENKDYYNKDYTYDWKFQDGLTLRLRINAYENKDTSDYRKVQVGVKTVEQPVYRVEEVIDAEDATRKLSAPTLAIEA